MQNKATQAQKEQLADIAYVHSRQKPFCREELIEMIQQYDEKTEIHDLRYYIVNMAWAPVVLKSVPAFFIEVGKTFNIDTRPMWESMRQDFTHQKAAFPKEYEAVNLTGEPDISYGSKDL